MAEEMLDLETAGVARTVAEECLGVAPGEEALVVTDPRRIGVGRAIARAVDAAGADAVTAIMGLLDDHGNEPPAPVAAAMREADVAFTCTTHAITHTRARLEAAEAGTRVGVLRGVTEGMLVEGAMTADFEAVGRHTRAVRDRLAAATEARVESDAGTDLTFSLAGSEAFALDGFYDASTGFAALPPGEAPTRPADGTAEGTVVVDASMDSLGLLDAPIRMTVEGGRVAAVEGGADADRLRETLADADANARNLAEFSVGTNPAATIIGNQAEDKKKAGTVHVALGDDESLGGTTASEIHLDAVVRRPTVWLDGELLVDDGRLPTDRLE